ncbi:MAG: hypothetical protein ACTSRE_08915 [Promethearchaeota archaeon]
MANKIGILNGFFLLMLNVLAEIPLGISFTLGIASYTGIPLMFAHDGFTAVYAWGTSDSGWWINLGIAGITGIIIEFLLVICCILSFIGSWIEGDRGRKMMGAILIIELIGFIYMIVDILVIGTLGITVSFTDIFMSLGGGTYLLLIVIVLQIFGIKTHNTEL